MINLLLASTYASEPLNQLTNIALPKEGLTMYTEEINFKSSSINPEETKMSVNLNEKLNFDIIKDCEPLAHLYEELLPEEKSMPMFEKIISFLTRQMADFYVMEHEAEGQSDKIALIRGNEPKQGAKAIVTMSSPSRDEQIYYLTVLPGDESLDFGKLKKLIGIKSTSMAPLDHVEVMTGCVRGSIPPFSFSPQINIVVDQSLIDQNTEIVFNAGRLDRSIFLKVKDYLRIARPRLVNIIKKVK